MTQELKLATLASLIGLLAFAGIAHAQVDDLPSPGLKPGDTFYFLDKFFEGIRTMFVFGDDDEAERYLALARERLAEAHALADDNNDAVDEAVERYDEQFREALRNAAEAKDTELEARVAEATTKHLVVLDEVEERVPEEAKEGIRTAKENSIRGQLETLRNIAERDTPRAVEIFAEAAEGRLQAAQARAEGSDNDEEEATEVEEALAEYEKYAEFGEEIASLAEGLQTGETTVEELVERATAHHRDVLVDVREKVPPQARESIERAMENAERMQMRRPEIPTRPDRDQRSTVDLPGARGENGVPDLPGEAREEADRAPEKSRDSSDQTAPVSPEPDVSEPDIPDVPQRGAY